MHGRRRQLHRAGEVRAGHRQARLVQPEQRLEVLLLGDGGVVCGHCLIVAGSGGAGAQRSPRIARPWRSRSSPRSSPSSRARGPSCRSGDAVGVRAQVRRLPGDRVRRRRRVHDPVARRQAAAALLPRAAVPAGALRARRRDRDRRPTTATRTSTRFRTASIPAAVADRDARRADAGALRRVRPARARRRDAARAAVRGAPRRCSRQLRSAAARPARR